jgi:anhydro-N-acetylmuramic acid kinase
MTSLSPAAVSSPDKNPATLNDVYIITTFAMIHYAIGLMSGSSLDGLDIAACTFDLNQLSISDWQLIAADTIPFPPEWQHTLQALPNASARDLAKAHADLGHWIGHAVNDFLAKHPDFIPHVIASHGHTIFHFPNEQFTTQIGDGAAIAAITGITTVTDFRSADIALQGQGAPVAPIADQLLFNQYNLLLNIGGIANLTCHANHKYLAFDIGGANQILNALANTIGLPYDDQGNIAASGQLIPELLEQLNQLDYFHQAPPKSLGNDWVQHHQVLSCLNWPAPLPDKLHTVCLHIAQQTAAALEFVIRQEKWHPDSFQMLVTGGGAFNTFLVKAIRKACSHLGQLDIILPEPGIIAFKEAILMALMGVLRMKGIHNCLASVTGAARNSVNGAVYYGLSSPQNNLLE